MIETLHKLRSIGVVVEDNYRFYINGNEHVVTL